MVSTPPRTAGSPDQESHNTWVQEQIRALRGDVDVSATRIRAVDQSSTATANSLAVTAKIQEELKEQTLSADSNNRIARPVTDWAYWNRVTRGEEFVWVKKIGAPWPDNRSTSRNVYLGEGTSTFVLQPNGNLEGAEIDITPFLPVPESRRIYVEAFYDRVGDPTGSLDPEIHVYCCNANGYIYGHKVVPSGSTFDLTPSNTGWTFDSYYVKLVRPANAGIAAATNPKVFEVIGTGGLNISPGGITVDGTPGLPATLEISPGAPLLSAPTTPTLTSSVGTVSVAWNGGPATERPRRAYVYAEEAPAAAGPWTRVGQTLIAQGQIITRPPVGSQRYYRLRAVDTSNRTGAASAAAGPITVASVDIPDIGSDILGAIQDAQQKADEAWAAAEVAVTSSLVEYAKNTSATVAPTTGWSSATPPHTPGSYIWMRTTVTYGDNSTDVTSPVLLTGNSGPQGIPGTPGTNGATTYTWLKYADTPTTGMSDSPDGKTYMGLATNKTTPTESTAYSDYSWSLIKGTDGLPGAPGDDGSSLYTWVKYADSASGAGMSDLPGSKPYIGFAYNKPTATESTAPGDYSWSLIKGADGSQGIQGPPGTNGTTTYTWLKYADTPTTGMSDSPTGKAYMGLAMNKTTATESSVYADYSWSLVKGSDGIPGTPGADGVTTYTWVKYADNASGGGMSDLPAGKAYIGMAYNKTTPTESSVPGDYTWSLIKGADGVGITSVTVYYRTVAAGAAAPAVPTTSPPPAPWATGEPAYVPNVDLYSTTRIVYSNATFSYTAPNNVSAYKAAQDAAAAALAAQTTADGKNRIRVSPTGPMDTDPPTFKQGDIWYQTNEDSSILQTVNIWNGISWSPYRFVANSIIVPGTVGTIALEDGAVTAPKVRARELEGDHLKIGSVSLDELTPNIGSSIDIRINPSIADLETGLEQQQRYYRFDDQGLKIGDPATNEELRLNPGSIEIVQAGNVATRWTRSTLEVDRMVVKAANIGEHRWEAQASGVSVIRPLVRPT